MPRSDSTLHPLLITAPAVLLVHALVLWWLQAAFQAPDKKEAPVLLSVRMLPPPTTAAPNAPPTTPTATHKTPAPRSARNSQPPPQPPQPKPTPAFTATATAPSADAPLPQARSVETPAPTPTTPTSTTTAALTTTAPASSASDKTTAHIELPISRASYLHNPEPAYPEISLRRREQGRVVINAFIGTDGLAHQTAVYRSSGYPRLDDAALAAVKTWRFVPGKRAGVPEAMWFSIPFSFGEKD